MATLPLRRTATGKPALASCLQELLAALPLAACVLDRDARVMFWNPAAQRVFGWRAEEVLGRSIPLVPREELDSLLESVRRDFGGESRIDTGTRLRKDGTRLDVDIYVSPLRDEGGQVIGVIRMFVDLTVHRLQQGALVAAEAGLRRSIAQRDAAVEKERTRIARELHDELGQALTSLKMGLADLGRDPAAPAPTQARLDALAALVDQTMAEVRRLSAELRPALLDVTGLFGAVQLQAQAFERRTGIPCRLKLPARPFDPGRDRTTTVFRVMQEILTNIARHSDASAVDIRLRRLEGRMVLEVEDDGCGFDAAAVRADAFGIVGMRERAEILGGALAVERRRPRGTRVRLTLPIG